MCLKLLFYPLPTESNKVVKTYWLIIDSCPLLVLGRVVRQRDLSNKRVRQSYVVSSTTSSPCALCILNCQRYSTYDHRLGTYGIISNRSVSSWVGDHQRIPVVICFCLVFFVLLFLFFFPRGHVMWESRESWNASLSTIDLPHIMHKYWSHSLEFPRYFLGLVLNRPWKSR